MSWVDISALAGAMVILALVPSVSVLAVTARAASLGFAHGVYTTLGIMLGDIIYILLAMFGLVLLSDVIGGAVALIPYIGAAYLVWMGVLLWQAGAQKTEAQAEQGNSPGSSFLAGLLITLADQKAVLFYLGFLPAFIDLEKVSPADASAIVVIAILTLGITKLGYAMLASRVGNMMGARAGSALNRIAAVTMFVIAIYMLLKS
ncbi:MAG: hypothetical protein GC184_03075 [Rhizobiales bacterium]|nr:hypothetical protein [Hyphomicrobiales bacterium]